MKTENPIGYLKNGKYFSFEQMQGETNDESDVVQPLYSAPVSQCHQEGKSIENCLNEVAKKHGLGTTLVMGHKKSYWIEAILLYAKSSPQTLELPSDAMKFGTWLSKNYFVAYHKDATYYKDGKYYLVEDLYKKFKGEPSKHVEKKEGEKDKLIYSWKDIYRAIQNDRKELRQTDCFQVPILPKIVINTKPIDV